MLILSRRVSEQVIIQDDIIITVLGIKGNQVRLGIKAPDNVSVHREEIWKKIQEEKALGINITYKKKTKEYSSEDIKECED